MQKSVIVATGPVDPIVSDVLARHAPVIEVADEMEKSLLPSMSNAVGLIVRGSGVATKRMIDSTLHLRVIARTGVGYDSVDVAAASVRKIPRLRAACRRKSSCRGRVTMMLALARNLFYWDRELKQGNWASRFHSNPRDLTGATVGVVGLGSVEVRSPGC